MVVDPRHDHSIRIPRPDLSVQLGTPNACNNCHKDKDAAWADQQVKAWYGHVPKSFQTYAQSLHGARREAPDAGSALVAMIRDPLIPNIARATALVQLGPYLGTAVIHVLSKALSDDNPLVRAAAVRALDKTPLNIRMQLAFPMLEDSVRAVRIESARVLAEIPAGDLSAEQQAALDKAIQEYVAAQQANAERPEAQTNLGNLYTNQGKAEQAVAAYSKAIELDPAYIPAYVNLADFYRACGKETDAENVLHRAVGIIPDNAALHHALGLTLVRLKRTDDALEEFRLASTYGSDDARYIYVYAVALNSAGKQEQSVIILQDAHNRFPGNRDILATLVAFLRDMGKDEAASAYAEKLLMIAP